MAQATTLTEDGTSKVLDSPEGKLHYHEAGDGPVLILIHGSGPGVSGWSNFKDNLATFSTKFRTLILDLPGFGRSDNVEGSPLATGPEAVIRFMDGLGVEKAHILGNSMGGMVATQVAANHSARVDRLVTIGGVGMPIFSPFPAEGIKLLVEFVEDPTREKLVTWMQSMVYDRSLITEEFVDERWKQATATKSAESISAMYSRASLDAMHTFVTGAVLAGSLTHLGQITAPTLITWGRDDRVQPIDMALVPLRVIPKAELHTFPNCGHWVMMERREEFESVVMAFLTRR